MKKYYILIVICLFIFVSCVITTTHEHNMSEAIQGSWLINKEFRTISFIRDSFYIEQGDGVLLKKGAFVNNPIPDDPSRWVWEKAPDSSPSVHWVGTDKMQGDMKHVKHLQDRVYETMIVTGLPYSENEMDTLQRGSFIIH